MRPLSKIGTGALRFADFNGNEFVVFLKWKCDSSITTSIDKPKDGRTLKEMVCTSDFANEDSKPKRLRTAPAAPDRVFWLHPDCSWSVQVAFRRQIIKGEKMLTVNISC